VFKGESMIVGIINLSSKFPGEVEYDSKKIILPPSFRSTKIYDEDKLKITKVFEKFVKKFY
jgi:hypothetical protein